MSENCPTATELQEMHEGRRCPKCAERWPPPENVGTHCDICYTQNLYNRIDDLRRQLAKKKEQIDRMLKVLRELAWTNDLGVDSDNQLWCRSCYAELSRREQSELEVHPERVCIGHDDACELAAILREAAEAAKENETNGTPTNQGSR